MAVTKNLLNIGDAQITGNASVNMDVTIGGTMIASTIKLNGGTGNLLRDNGTTIVVPGTTNTYLRGDGTWQNVTTSDNKTAQSSETGSTQNRPILFAYAENPNGGASGAYYNSNISINPKEASLKIKSCKIQYNSSTNSLDFKFV